MRANGNSLTNFHITSDTNESTRVGTHGAGSFVFYAQNKGRLGHVQVEKNITLYMKYKFGIEYNTQATYPLTK